VVKEYNCSEFLCQLGFFPSAVKDGVACKIPVENNCWHAQGLSYHRSWASLQLS